jgi:multidrug efflux pump subunit AcrA (membrane-fusion protein)
MTDHHHDTIVHDAQASAAPAVTPMGGARLRTFAIGAAIALVLLLVLTMLPRHSVSRELLADAAARDSAPVVQVATVVRSAPGSTLTLPGTVQPLHESAIYARVGGYVRRWSADIGTLVHTGTLLAEIDAPELEQNVQQARSQVQMTQAALQLAKTDLARWTSLERDSAVTSQELDQKRAAYASAVANTAAAEANLRRLVETRGFTRIVAPFTGVVTARNVDFGSLISASGATSTSVGGGSVGGGAATSGSLFRVAQTDTVRAYITVPATYATSIRPGLEAQVDVQGLNGRHFSGRVVRTSASLDASTRTLLAEVDIPNRDFAILPGMYAQVTLNFPRVSPPIVVPASALVIRSAGPQVMVVDATGGSKDGIGTLRLQSVQIGRDYGSTMEILDGLLDGTSIVTNPNADLSDGMRVRTVVRHK